MKDVFATTTHTHSLSENKASREEIRTKTRLAIFRLLNTQIQLGLKLAYSRLSIMEPINFVFPVGQYEWDLYGMKVKQAGLTQKCLGKANDHTRLFTQTHTHNIPSLSTFNFSHLFEPENQESFLTFLCYLQSKYVYLISEFHQFYLLNTF